MELKIRGALGIFVMSLRKLHGGCQTFNFLQFADSAVNT